MTKLIGALLLVTVTVIFAFVYTHHQRKRVLQAEGFLLLLRYLRGQILCYALPIEEALRGYENDALTECGFLPLLRQGSFLEALEGTRSTVFLEKDAQKALRSFGEGVGKSYREDQLALCDYTLGELERTVDRLREEYPRKVKLGRSLVISGGLALVLVLL